MDNANGDGITKLHPASDTPANSDAHRGPTNLDRNKTGESTVQKRTRSQLNVPDLILHLPLARSPLKDAKKARAQTQTHPWSSGHLQSRKQGDVDLVPSEVIEAQAQGEVYDAEEGEEEEDTMDTSTPRTQRREEEEEEKELVSPGKSRNLVLDSKREDQTAMQATSTKKRTSPEPDPTRLLASPNGERQPKRAKVEALRLLGRREIGHTEYHEPLRDPDFSPHRSKGNVRAASMRPTPSTTETASSSIFPQRAKSVPLEREDDVRAVDLTAIQHSPQRSPNRTSVEIRRAPSLPPPDPDAMDIDSDEASGPTHFNVSVATPRTNLAFNYTVNFATPRGFTTLATRSGHPMATPMSPLTPLPPTPFVDRLPVTQFLLLKAKSNLNTLSEAADIDDDIPTSPIDIPAIAQMTTSPSIDTVKAVSFIAHVPPRPSSATSTSQPASEASVPEKAKGRARAATVAGVPSQTDPGPSTGSAGAAKPSATTSIDLSSNTTTPDSQSEPTTWPTILPKRRPSVIGAMKPKRGPSVPPGPRRITRSVSMKEQKVGSGSRGGTETAVTGGNELGGPSVVVRSMPYPSMIATSKPGPPKSTAVSTTKLKPPPAVQKAASSTSIHKPLPDPTKFKQTSLNLFIKAKPPTSIAASFSSSAASTSTNSGTSSKVAPLSSPSKIPLPISPAKRPLAIQTPGKLKPLLVSFGSTGSSSGSGSGSGVGTIIFGGASTGRSLTTLSHALEKLVVPPPSRPNTSMGFSRGEGAGETVEGGKGEGPTGEKEKEKRKAKDDASLPSTSATQGSGTTFARPTVSSLKRSATVTASGPSFVARMRGRGGAPSAVTGRGSGTIGIFGKVGERASKKTSLPSVMGSPVKSSGAEGDDERCGWRGSKSESRLSRGGTNDGQHKMAEGEGGSVLQVAAVAGGGGVEAVMHDIFIEAPGNGSGSAAARKPSSPAKSCAEPDIDLTSSPISAVDKGKQQAAPHSTLNPASSALHALSESLSSLPQTPTPPKPRAAGTRTGLRSASVAVGKGSPGDASGSIGPGGSNEVNGSGGPGPIIANANGTVNGSGGTKKSSLKILKRCAIFVDVRTEQGDDAGSLFVDMLKGLGAKIMGRIGQSCTHIVYKNGLSHTLTRYRMLDDPKPFVVGIAWVVECVEQRTRVDEERFKVDVDMINVAGGNKRRRSMLPKHLIPHSPVAGTETTFVPNTSSEADEDEDGGGTDGSPLHDPDTSIRSKDEDDLPPLERARRRRSALPGGQSRLIP
ncbi:hypothetical protein PAXRUDRAFT_28587 [Paxillus rubicundulus Ve08.2h10]|uniref:BRCT domain-containing protein n=1 Tax=Paxillus rubicundulus Ve08.2h10 TaxID=930991 RepID=A0A0D0DK48_9AGAM|nr:hypothetical protein PAXRUDRAFT_28587 [Paxillus rubicundulus Ve08.2h10]